MVDKIEVYGHVYDRKLFINGMCSLLTQNELPETVSMKALQIIDSLVTTLKIQQMAEMKEREKRKNLETFSDDDEHPNRNFFNKGLGKVSNQEIYDDDEDEDDEDFDDDLDEDDENDDFDDDDGIDFSKENEEVLFF